MTDYPTIWLLRHGQTEWNARRLIQGQLESHLTPLGKRQALKQAGLIAGVLAQRPACYVSPLGRAQQTARIALGDVAFVTDPRLAEVHAGIWQGRGRDEVEAGWPELFHANPRSLDLFTAAPGGESFAALRARVADFMGDLNGPSVVVAHGLLGQVMRGLACGLERAEMAVLPNEQGCVYLLAGGKEQVLR